VAAIQSRDQFPPAYSKRFTSFASDLDLDGAAAPTGVNWLPCQVIIEHGAADVFAYTDFAGTAVAITFPVEGVTVLRLAPHTIETETTAVAVTVCWQGYTH
jgi:hypothetical protein